MHQRGPHAGRPKREREAAREQAVVALEHWLNAEAEAAQPVLGPVRRVGPWPCVTTLLGTLAGVVGIDMHDPVAPVLVVGGFFLASASIGTIVERIRERVRLATLARGALLGMAQASPAPEPPEPEPPGSPLPRAIAAPLERARNACAGISRIAGDPAWTRLQVPVKEHEVSARAQFQALEQRAGRLAMIGEMLAPTSGVGEVPAHLQELAGIYQAHCQGMLSAAEVFERAQASLARALLALTAGTPGAGAADSALQEIGAAFDSLAQVLESLGRPPAPAGTSLPAAQAPPRERVKG